MKKPLRDQINELNAMSGTELEKQHLQLFGEEPATTHRQFLFRKIAWRLQADREGGSPESARELARAIAQDTPLRNRVISNVGKQRAGIPIDQSVRAHRARASALGRIDPFVLTYSDPYRERSAEHK